MQKLRQVRHGRQWKGIHYPTRAMIYCVGKRRSQFVTYVQPTSIISNKLRLHNLFLSFSLCVSFLVFQLCRWKIRVDVLRKSFIGSYNSTSSAGSRRTTWRSSRRSSAGWRRATRATPAYNVLYYTVLYWNALHWTVLYPLYLAVHDPRLLVPVVHVEAVLMDPGSFNWDNQ